MGETGEGVRPTRLREIKLDDSVVGWLKDQEKEGSKESFKNRMRSWPEVKGVDSIKRASGMAVNKVADLLRDKGVLGEMVNLGVRVDIGRFSVSVGRKMMRRR